MRAPSTPCYAACITTTTTGRGGGGGARIIAAAPPSPTTGSTSVSLAVVLTLFALPLVVPRVHGGGVGAGRDVGVVVHIQLEAALLAPRPLY